jgi:LysR family transcriptional regulator (chromosome initiation inhibitor)
VRALRAGWGAAVLPQLLVQTDNDAGTLVNICPSYTLPIALYWHCWNLQSEVLNALSNALQASALDQLSGTEAAQKNRKP